MSPLGLFPHLYVGVCKSPYTVPRIWKDVDCRALRNDRDIGWPMPQVGSKKMMNQLWVHQRKGLFSARDLRDLRQGCLSTCCGCMDSTSSSLLHGITPPCPATLAMVLASSLYAESSVHELDWPTCWARKQQKRALKMLRPRGFLGEDLETRPRAEGM